MSTTYLLEFEKPLREIERRLEEIEAASKAPAAPPPADSEPSPAANGVTTAPPPDSDDETERLRKEHRALMARLYKQLSPWDTVRVARHPRRPQTRDYINLVFKDFCELHGDRRFGDDPAIVTGFARLGSIKCLVVGHQKGRTTQEKLSCHFGCAHPEGYRKALAKMKLAEKFGLPVVTFVDTPGAYPGLGAEQRGQAEAIAVNLREMSRLATPVVSVVIGEGGSGGALGIAVADKVAMLQHSWYSVISPEGCAAILWKTANEENNFAAARALRLTAKDNLKLGIVDAVIPEPPGGAHRDPDAAASELSKWLTDRLRELKRLKPATLLERRHRRFRRLGAHVEESPVPSEA